MALANRLGLHKAILSAQAAEPKALQTHKGGALAEAAMSQLTSKYPYIISLCAHERQYLATPNTHGTGYDVEIELQRSLRKQDDGYRGSYQVYDDGRSVGFLGSSEWRVGDK